MGCKDTRDDTTFFEDVRRLKKTLFSLLDRNKPKDTVTPARTGRVMEVQPSLTVSKPARPPSRFTLISLGMGRDMRLLSDLPDHEIIRIAKKGGRVLKSGDVAQVRRTAGDHGQAADVISAMDNDGLFDS